MLSTNKLRVLIVADDPLAGAGLTTMLTTQAGYIVADQVSPKADLTAALEVHRPDAILWDLGRGSPSSSLDLLDDVKSSKVPIVALLPDETWTADAQRAGARGLLLREANAIKIAAALEAAAHGLVVLDPALAATSTPSRDRTPAPLVEELTPREFKVLQLLAEGLPNKAIAQRLGISEHTVKFHVNAILDKLNAQSRTEAVVTATRLGLILL